MLYVPCAESPSAWAVWAAFGIAPFMPSASLLGVCHLSFVANWAGAGVVRRGCAVSARRICKAGAHDLSLTAGVPQFHARAAADGLRFTVLRGRRGFRVTPSFTARGLCHPTTHGG